MRRTISEWFWSVLAVAALAGHAAAQTFTWNTTTGSWNTAANWDTNSIPTSGTTTELVFNVTGAGYTTTNNIGPFQLNRLTINHTGTSDLVIAGSSTANTLTLVGTDPTITTTGSGITRFTGLFAGSGIINYNGGPGEFRQDANNGGFTGTLIINSGTFRSINTSGTHNFNPVQITVNNGGRYIFGLNTAGNPNIPNSTNITVNEGGILRSEEGEDFGGITLNGGTIEMALGNFNMNGSFATTLSFGTIEGPSVIAGSAVINKIGTGTVTINNSALQNTGSLNIQNGTISTDRAFVSTGNVILGALGSAPVYQFRGTNPIVTTRPLRVAGDGGTIDVQAAAGQATISAAVTLDSPLTKTGPGTLTLGSTTISPTGASGITIEGGFVSIPGLTGFTGPSQINNGTLQVTPNATPSTTAVTVAAGGTFSVNSGAGTTSFTTSAINLPAAGGTLAFDITNTLPTAPLLVVSNTDGLTFTGTQILRINSNSSYPTGTFTAIDYNGTPITSGFNLFLQGRTSGSLVYDTTNTRIDVNILGSDSVRWNGNLSNDWDIGTAINVGGTNNFQLVSNSSATNFIQTDSVLFNDAATSFAVNLTGVVLPASVTFDNTTTYTLSGAGRISGTTPVTKNNTGTLILATDNDYSGLTTVNGGTLQIGNGGTSGSVTSNITLANNTTLAFNRSDNTSFANTVTFGSSNTVAQLGTGTVTWNSGITLGTNNLTVQTAGPLNFRGVLTGSGEVFKTGTGTWTLLANNNPFTGTLTIDGGLVLLDDLGAGGDLGAALINVNSGGSFQFGTAGVGINPDLPDTTRIVVNTGGTVIWDIGENYGGLNVFGGTYLARGNSTLVDLLVNSEWHSGILQSLVVANPSIGGATGIDKVTAGTISITGINLTNTGSLNIQQGVLETNANLTGAGPVGLGDGSNQAILRFTGTTTQTLSRPLTLNGDAVNESILDVSDPAGLKTYSGVIAGASGVLTKAGPGTLTLTATNNTYGGTTFVTAGTLLVNGQSGTNSGTGTGAVNVANGATFGGNGRAAGAVIVDAGGTITAGNAPATQTLTLGSTLNLNGTYRVQLFGTGATEISRINTEGNITLGGSSGLTIALAGVSVADLRTAVGVGNTQTYTIADAGLNTVSGTFSTTDFVTAGFDASEWQVIYNPASIQLTFTPVPEPGLMLGLTVAGGLIVGGIRRRLKGSVVLN